MKKYYKATYDMKCRDMVFAVGETYTISTPLKICKPGFHFCENAPDVLGYYPIKFGFTLLEVSPLGEIVTIGNKSCTNSLKILRIIPKEEAEALLKTDWKFDKNNNVIHYKSSSGIEYWNEYDSNHNMIHVKNSSGFESWYEYDSNNNLIHYKDSSGFERWNKYDSNNNLIHVKDSSGIEYWYEYDSNNNLIHSKDSSGIEFWYEYDSNNNLIHYKNSSGIEFWYDSKRNGITKEQFNEKT